MNEKDDEAPIPREPWQRLLEESADAPPETTDARIRAAARRDLAPRGRRWWLPASLAASFVLAVLIVHSEFGTIRLAPQTSADRSGGPAMDARLVDRHEGPESREAGESPSAAPVRADRPARAAPAVEDYGYAEPETGSDLPGVGPRIGGPEHDLKAATEQPEEARAGYPASPAPAAAAPDAERDPGEFVVSGDRKREEALQSAPVTSAGAQGIAPGRADRTGAVFATPPTPEAWYALIEKLRAEGRDEEADRELARLEAAYPGWLEKYLATQAPR